MGAWVFRRDRAAAAPPARAGLRDVPGLPDKRRARAGELSGGQGRMLSVAREMMTRAAAAAGRRADRGPCAQSGGAGLRHPRSPRRRRAASRSCWSSRTSSRRCRSPITLSSQPRPGEGRGAGPGIRQHARAGADSGMSAGLTKGWGAFVDWRRVALARWRWRRRRLLRCRCLSASSSVHVLAIGAYYVILAVSWNMLAGFTGPVLARPACALPRSAPMCRGCSSIT